MSNLPQFNTPSPQPQQQQTGNKPVKKGFNWGVLAVTGAGVAAVIAFLSRKTAGSEPEAPEKTEGEKIREEIKRQKDPAAVALGKRGGRPRKKKPETEHRQGENGEN